MSDKNVSMNQNNEPKDDSRYHNTWLLLKKYRDVTWSMEVSVAQSKNDFQKEFGAAMEDYLASYNVGFEIRGARFVDRAQGLERSYRMLQLLDSAIDTLRNKHKRGESYYWILYYTYLSPQEFRNTEEIIEALRPYMRDISYRTYYRKRKEAIYALSSLLWGYTDKAAENVLGQFVPGNKK